MISCETSQWLFDIRAKLFVATRSPIYCHLSHVPRLPSVLGPFLDSKQFCYVIGKQFCYIIFFSSNFFLGKECGSPRTAEPGPPSRDIGSSESVPQQHNKFSLWSSHLMTSVEASTCMHFSSATLRQTIHASGSLLADRPLVQMCRNSLNSYIMLHHVYHDRHPEWIPQILWQGHEGSSDAELSEPPFTDEDMLKSFSNYEKTFQNQKKSHKSLVLEFRWLVSATRSH